MSKNEVNKEFLLDIMDNPYYAECARCELTSIHESAVECPRCHLPFGPCGKYAILPISPSMTSDVLSTHGRSRLPDLPSMFSFIVFQCDFVDRIGCTLYGFGPVCIENVMDVPVILSEGKLLHSQGEYANCLEQRGLLPSIGDILLSVDGVGVGHLAYTEVRNCEGGREWYLRLLYSCNFSNSWWMDIVETVHHAKIFGFEAGPSPSHCVPTALLSKRSQHI